MYQGSRLRGPLPVSLVRQQLDRKSSPRHFANDGRLSLVYTVALQEVRLHVWSQRIEKLDDCALHSVKERRDQGNENSGDLRGKRCSQSGRSCSQPLRIHDIRHLFSASRVSKEIPALLNTSLVHRSRFHSTIENARKFSCHRVSGVWRKPRPIRGRKPVRGQSQQFLESCINLPNHSQRRATNSEGHRITSASFLKKLHCATLFMKYSQQRFSGKYVREYLGGRVVRILGTNNDECI